MWADAWELIRLYWRLDWRDGQSKSKFRILIYVVSVLAAVMAILVSGGFGYSMARLFTDNPAAGIPLGILPGIILTMVLLGVLLSGLNQAVKSLFLSGDLDRLMVAPIHMRSVIIAKLLGRVPSTILILLLAGFPALVGYGIGMGAGPVYYLLGAFLVAIAPFFGLAVGAIIAMLLVRLLPANRLNELMTAAFAVIGLGMALVPQFFRFLGTDIEDDAAASSSLATLLSGFDTIPFPPFMAGRGLVTLDQGQFDSTGLVGIVVYILMTIGLFLAFVMTADRLYLAGWLKTQSGATKQRTLDEGGGQLAGGSLAVAMAWKDWLLRLRDPRQLVSLLSNGVLALVLGALTLFRFGDQSGLLDMTAAGDFNGAGPPSAILPAFSSGVMMATYALFTAFMVMSNTASYAMALEGSAFPNIKVAPVRPREVWLAKVWSVTVPFAAIYTIFLIVGWLLVRYDLRWLPYGLVVGLLIGLTLMVVNVSAGFRYANMGWDDPRRMLTNLGGLIAFALSIVVGVVGGLLSLIPFVLSAIWPQQTLLLVVAGLLLLAAAAGLCIIVMRRWAEKAWYQLPA